MKTFTIFIGSAYHDARERHYIVEADNAELACGYAQRVAKAHDSSATTVHYCISGIVEFHPTLFDEVAEKNGLANYKPELIDLRQPALVRMSHWAVIDVPTHALAKKMVKLMGDRSLLSKVQVVPGEFGYQVHLLMPARMGEEKAGEILRSIFVEVGGYKKPISTTDEMALQAMPVRVIELPTEE
jgi:hypothetical protein